MTKVKVIPSISCEVSDEADIRRLMAWQQRKKEQERYRAHREVNSRLKHRKKPAPTKRQGIGATRLRRRRRNLVRTEQFAQRERELSLQQFDLIALDDDALEYYGDGFRTDQLILSRPALGTEMTI